MNDEEYIEWLRDDSNERCILVDLEVADQNGTVLNLHVSTANFLVDAGVNSIEYLPVVASDFVVSERLPIRESTASLTISDLVLENSDGLIDHWINYVYSNRPITVWHGDKKQPKDTFVQVFSGIMDGISTGNDQNISIKFKDLMQRLNHPLSDVTIGGTEDNKDNLRPLVFGKIFNAQPVLWFDATHAYLFNSGSSESLLDVKDNGLSVAFTATNSGGYFALTQKPVGQLTFDAKGINANGYQDTCAGIIKDIVQNWGVVENRFTDSELDIASFSVHKIDNPLEMGAFFQGRKNCIEAIKFFADSSESFLVPTTKGTLKLIQLNNPDAIQADDTTINETHIYDGSFSIEKSHDVTSSTKILYRKNYTIQTNLQTDLTETQRQELETEWKEKSLVFETQRALYRQSEEPVAFESAVQDDTTTEFSDMSLARANLFLTKRMTFSVKTVPHKSVVDLGKGVILYYPRFGLDAGERGILINKKTTYPSGDCEMEILI